MAYVCEYCVKDVNLKLFIQQYGYKQQCSFCEEEQIVVDIANYNFAKLLKTIIRFYYAAFYNSNNEPRFYVKSQNLSLKELFFLDENKFFKLPKRPEIYADILDEMIFEDNLLGDLDNEISFTNKFDFFPLSTPDHPYILSIKNTLKTHNYFNFEQHIKEILNEYAQYLTEYIKLEEFLYRARIGKDKIEEEKGYRVDEQDIFKLTSVYMPYTKQNISAPPPPSAKAGRANRQGVSFFYAATNEYTAISEVRPEPTDKVSVATFRIIKQAKIYDLTGMENKLIHFYELELLIEKIKIIHTLCKQMEIPASPNDYQDQYFITQLISDCVRQLGFDGIKFNSTLDENGKNIVLFNSSDFLKEESNKVVEIQSVSYQYFDVTYTQN